jgi:CBS domain-containing protein
VRNPRISGIMTAAPATVSPDDDIGAAERVMRERRCHHAPVVRDGRLVGMVTAGELLKALVLRPQSGPESVETQRVADLMRRNVVALPETATLRDAAVALARGSMHALPVVRADDVLVGIVTSTDLIETLVEDLSHPAPEPSTSDGAQTHTTPQAKRLREVYEAAQRYLESGRAEIEHGRLVQAVDRAREALTRSATQI